ncbi:SxtJ family membrane protein [Pelagibacteraceae bacterium]|nr:SxtJ family membrane protein [Pelagibacteraceae bacterium]
MKKSSEKSFGILFFIVFLFVGFWPTIEGQSIRIWSIIISLTFLTLGIFNSKILTPLNNSWIKLGEILGKIIAPIVMALIYFTVLTPISLIIRIFGKDLLEKKFSKKNSYWIKREKNIGSMKKQF